MICSDIWHKLLTTSDISITSSKRICMICSDIWHKLLTTSDISKLLYEILRTVRRVKFETVKFEISRMVFVPNITYKSCYYMFILLPSEVLYFSHVGYFKLSWNTTALIQSNRRNFLCSSSIKAKNKGNKTKEFWKHFFIRRLVGTIFRNLQEVTCNPSYCQSFETYTVA